MDVDATDDGPSHASLDEARLELDRAAEDLERLTERLEERTERIEWLESLLDELLELLTVPALVLDDDHRVLAASRGAEDRYPAVAEGLGRRVPDPLAGELDVVLTLPGGSTLVVLPS
jgi:hypothetical protein